jgi:hypothetical protein
MPLPITPVSSGAVLENSLIQAAHGFTVGQWVYLNGTSYALVDSDSAASTNSIGVVTSVLGVNSFTIATSGFVTIPGASFTGGTKYYVSGTPGQITSTEPTNSKVVFIAAASTTGYIQQYVTGATVTGDYAGAERRSADVNTNLFTISSTNIATFSTLLGTANRVNLTSATTNGTLTINGANGTIAIAKTGVYTITTNVSVQSAGSTGQWGQMVKNNATVLTASAAYNQTGGAGLQIVLTYTGNFAAGDLIDTRVNSTAAGTIGVIGYSYGVNQISGFLPVSGQTVDYIQANRITSNQSVVLNDTVIYNSIGAGNIPYNISTGIFTLTAGKTYNLFAASKVRNDGTGGTGRYVQFEWVDAVSNVILPGLKQGVSVMATSVLNESATDSAGGIYTPSTNQTVKVRITGLDGTNVQLDFGRTSAVITQLGSTSNTVGTLPAVDQSSAGYFDIGNMRMQWGTLLHVPSTGPITFPAPFANTNYTVVASSAAGVNIFVTTGTKTTSNFICTTLTNVGSPSANNPISYYAIGQKP